MAASPLLVVIMVMPLMVLASEIVINPIVPKEGEEFLLECEGEGPMAYFLLHQKGEGLGVGVHDELKIEVFENATVFFQSVEMSHSGTHLCLRNNPAGGALHGYEAPFCVRPLPPTDLWGEVYKTKFVTGFIAALVVAAAFVLGILVYKYRWQPVPEKDRQPIVTTEGYDNPGMASGEDIESCSTKM